MIALIDADSIIHVVAWHNREETDPLQWLYSADRLVNNILLLTGAAGYYGVFSHSTCFRHDRYLFKAYKGTRPEKPEWFMRQAPVIRSHLCEQWGFFTPYQLEADDVVCWMAEALRNQKEPKNYVVCSPDKDLKQIPGMHYDYSKDVKCVITPEEADYHFWMQMLMGDDTDNIAGIPGMGQKKAETVLKDVDPIAWRMLVEGAYYKYFGSYYGSIIFAETYDTVKLMCENHAFHARYYHNLQEHLVLNYQGYVPSLSAPNSASDALAMFAMD